MPFGPTEPASIRQLDFVHWHMGVRQSRPGPSLTSSQTVYQSAFVLRALVIIGSVTGPAQVRSSRSVGRISNATSHHFEATSKRRGVNDVEYDDGHHGRKSLVLEALGDGCLAGFDTPADAIDFARMA